MKAGDWVVMAKDHVCVKGQILYQGERGRVIFQSGGSWVTEFNHRNDLHDGQANYEGHDRFRYILREDYLRLDESCNVKLIMEKYEVQ